MNPAAPIASQSLSKSELPALTHQALEADLIQISTTLLARGWMLATAESCTGGMIAAACTDLAWNRNPGTVAWQQPLAAGATAQFSAEHTIRYPKDLDVQERQ